MESYIDKMPKSELHCHLDGSIPLETLYILAKKNNLDPKIMNNVIAPEKCKDLNEYLDSFKNILLVLQSKENLIEATYSLIKSVSQENVRYLEIRFAPLLHTEGSLEIEDAIDAVTEGIQKGMRDYNIFVNLLICCMRYDDNKVNQRVISKVSKIQNDIIVGFDFAGNEKDYANDSISDLTEEIYKREFQLTLHSGECGCAHNIAQAIALGAKRIGHGVAITNRTDILFTAIDKKIHFELCPTSNYQTNAIVNYEELPLKLFLDNNISCSINTDNRTVSNTTLSKEFKLVQNIFSLTKNEIYKLSLNAINHSFASERIKNEIVYLMKDYYESN